MAYNEFYQPSGAQQDLAATTDVSLYTCPTGKTAEVSIVFANRTGGAIGVRLALARKGVTLAAQHYLMYDVSIAANTSIIWSGLKISSGDIVWVRASAVGMTASLFVDDINQLSEV